MRSRSSNEVAARVAIVAMLTVVAATTAAWADGSAAERYKGLSLAEALQLLRSEGLKVIYSTDLVRSDMRVGAEPSSGWPREILDELLAPHGLCSRTGPRDTLLVVKKPAAGSIRGAVRDLHSARPVADVVVRVLGTALETRSDAQGRLEIAAVPVGTYALKASRSGYLPSTLGDVVVTAGGTTAVRFELSAWESSTEEVVVTANDPGATRNLPHQSDSLDRDELIHAPGIADDAIRAAARAPGFVGNDASAGLHVRGGGDDEVMIVLDGLELYEPFHLKDRQGPLSIIDSRNVGNLDLFGGAFPAEYGGRMSGVVAMDSVAPAAGLHTGIAVSSEGAGIVGEGGIHDGRGRWLLSARMGNAANVLEALGADPNYDPRFYDLFAKAGYDIGEKTSLAVNFLFAEDELEGGDDERIQTIAYPGTFRSRYTDRYVWLTWKTPLRPGLYAQSIVYAGSLSHSRIGSLSGLVEIDDQRSTKIFGLKQGWALERSRHVVKWGFDLKALSADYRYVSAPSAPEDSGFDSGAVELNSRPSGLDLGLHLSDRIRVSRHLTLETGLRWDRQTYTESAESTLSPRLNMAYALGPRSTLRAGWGWFHQPQRINELQIADGVDRFAPAQRAEHRVLGWDYGFADGPWLRLSIYEKRMSHLQPRYENLFDPFGFLPEASWDRVRIAPDRALARGIELSANGSARSVLDWRIGYAWATVEDRIDGGWVPRSWDQRNTLDLGLDYRIGSKWSFGLTGLYHSGRPTTPVSAEPRVIPDGGPELVRSIGPRNTERLPDYHRMDIRITRFFSFHRMDARLFLNVTNLYDRKNVCCIRSFEFVPQPEGSVAVEREETHGLARLVSFGFGWRF